MTAKLKALSKETFVNLSQFHWSIKPLGSYELVVRGPVPTDGKSRRQTKCYGCVLNVRCSRITKTNSTPIIQVHSNKGWLHLDPMKYDHSSTSDITIGGIMSKPITAKHTINARMGKILYIGFDDWTYIYTSIYLYVYIHICIYVYIYIYVYMCVCHSSIS